MTSIDTNDPIVRAALYAVLGLCYGGGMYLAKVLNDPSVSFNKRKLGKTLLVWTLAGVVVATQGGDDAGFEAFEAAAATAAVLVDRVWNQYRSNSTQTNR